MYRGYFSEIGLLTYFKQVVVFEFHVCKRHVFIFVFVFTEQHREDEIGYNRNAPPTPPAWAGLVIARNLIDKLR